MKHPKLGAMNIAEGDYYQDAESYSYGADGINDGYIRWAVWRDDETAALIRQAPFHKTTYKTVRRWLELNQRSNKDEYIRITNG